MKILHFCNKPPYPPKDGGAIGMNNTSLGLHRQGHDVCVLALNTPKHFVNFKDVDNKYLDKVNLHLIDCNTEIHFGRAFLNLLSLRSYNIERFDKKHVHEKLILLLSENNFDLVIIESVFLYDYVKTIRNNSNSKIVFRAPNIEYKIWESLAKEAKNPLKSSYLKLLAKRLKRHEGKLSKQVDGIICVSENDKNYFADHTLVPISVIQTGIDMSKMGAQDEEIVEDKSVFFIGALDWLPNLEGLKWFIEKSWPLINNRLPNSTLHIAGRNCPEWVKKYSSPQIKVYGEVEDAREFMMAHRVMVVPLFSGSGMRVKLVEGMMLKKAIVTTKMGADGLNSEAFSKMLIEDNPKIFAQHVIALLSNDSYYKEITLSAFDWASQEFDNQRLEENLDSFVESISNPS